MCSVQNAGVGKWRGREGKSEKFSRSYTVDVHTCMYHAVGNRSGLTCTVSTSLVQEDANIMHSGMIKFEIKVKITCTFFLFLCQVLLEASSSYRQVW